MCVCVYIYIYIYNQLPRPPPGDLPHPEIKPASLTSPALTHRFFTVAPREKPVSIYLSIDRYVIKFTSWVRL